MDWPQFIKKNKASFLSLALKYTRNLNDAEDIVQDAMLSIFEREYYDKPAAAARIIIVTQCINLYRRNKRMRFSEIEDYKQCSDFNEIDRFISSDQISQVKEILTPNQFRLIHDFGIGYKYKEISEEAGIHIGTVKSRIHIARKRLARARASGVL
jgi:RNA polymerase sigma-70 factor (ECF subfamily)